MRTTLRSIKVKTLECIAHVILPSNLEFANSCFDWTDVGRDSHHVVANLSRNATTTKTADSLSFKGSIVIGADGAQSRIRRTLWSGMNDDDMIKPTWTMLTITTSVLHKLVTPLLRFHPATLRGCQINLRIAYSYTYYVDFSVHIWYIHEGLPGFRQPIGDSSQCLPWVFPKAAGTTPVCHMPCATQRHQVEIE
jgi:hypothetical protein